MKTEQKAKHLALIKALDDLINAQKRLVKNEKKIIKKNKYEKNNYSNSRIGNGIMQERNTTTRMQLQRGLLKKVYKFRMGSCKHNTN